MNVVTALGEKNIENWMSCVLR